MGKRMEVYKCSVCGQITQVMNGTASDLVCCGKPMKLLKENTTEAAVEKHIPVIEKIAGGYRVFVGEAEHPMSEEHYIEWIELIAGNDIYTHYLNPGEKPEAIFKIDAENVTARAYCNLHGLWKK